MTVEDKAWVYFLKCSDGSTGKTQDLEQGVAQHQNGTLKGYTSNSRPVELVYSEAFSTYNEAIQAERQIKGWSRAKKEALIEEILKYCMFLLSVGIRAIMQI